MEIPREPNLLMKPGTSSRFCTAHPLIRNSFPSITYVLPGTTPGAGQTALPSDIENAVVEQGSYWFTNRDKLGLTRNRPNAGTYEQFPQFDLIPSAAQVIRKYQR